MAFTDLQASFGAQPWSGVYTKVDVDLWTNGDYYIYRDPWYWMVSDSAYIYEPVNPDYPLIPGHLKARLVFSQGTTPAGSYTGVDGNPDGTVINFPS